MSGVILTFAPADVNLLSMVDPAPRDERIEQVRRAAVEVFGQHGLRGTSMAMIAEAVGVSRPALYQWFENREDVFRAAMELVLDESADAAVAALEQGDDLAGALSGWLHHGFADGYARLVDSPHGAELLEAHHAFTTDVAQRASARMRSALERYLRDRPDVGTAEVDAALELLLLAPAGLKADQPTPAVFRRRLDQLAAAVAATLRGS